MTKAAQEGREEFSLAVRGSILPHLNHLVEHTVVCALPKSQYVWANNMLPFASTERFTDGLEERAGGGGGRGQQSSSKDKGAARPAFAFAAAPAHVK